MKVPTTQELRYSYSGTDIDGDKTYTIHVATVQQLIKDALMSAPEGYALVPVEPDQGMLDAGHHAKWHLGRHGDVTEIYKAMITAAKESNE